MSFENLLFDRDGAVAILTINRPPVLNALNSATIDELRRAVLDVKRDQAIRVLIITGAGDKSFVAGADINELEAAEALRIGLVNRVVPREALMAAAMTLASQLAAKAPIAMQYIIEAVNRGLDLSLDKAQFLEATMFGLVASTDDMREGTQAF